MPQPPPPLATHLHAPHHPSLQARDPASPSDSWLIFSILVAIAATAAFILFVMWASDVLILRCRRRKAYPAKGTELATIGGPRSRDSNDDNRADYRSAGGGRSGRGSSGDSLASVRQKSIDDDGASRINDQEDNDEGFPARPPRAYGRRVEEEGVNGMVPVKGVEMV